MNEQSLGKYYDQGFFPGLTKAMSPLSGIGSIPDVIQNTNFESMSDTLFGMPARYVWNIIRGIGGAIPGIETPQYATSSDVMDKYGILQDSPILKDIIGFGADIAVDPTTYVGGSLLGKIGGKAASGIKGLSRLY